jgi:hypothetical protein
VGILNYTTKIAEEKTVGEIMGILGKQMARSIRIDYDERGRPKAISFMLVVKEQQIPFQLPCNFEGVMRTMVKEYKDQWTRTQKQKNPEYQAQVRRVAWRIVKDWVEAQMALVQAEQAELAEVFLPYAVRRDGRTFFQHFMEGIDPSRTLTAGDSE